MVERKKENQQMLNCEKVDQPGKVNQLGKEGGLELEKIKIQENQKNNLQR